MERLGTRRAIVLLALTLGGCEFPKDANSTLERVRAGQPLRIGWSAAEPWTRGTGAQEPHGIESELVRVWAQSLGARIEWVAGGEAQLVQALQENTVDVALAGFEKSAPWGGKIGQTQPYLKTGIVIGAREGTTAPGDWEGVEVRYDRRRPQIAAALRGIGAVPVPTDPGQLAPIGAVYDFELSAAGLRPTGKPLTTERRVIATAPAENALTLSLDRFLQPRESEIRARLTAELR